MQTFSETDLRDAQALLPDSVQQLISVIGFPALTRLIRSFGGVTLSGKTGAHAGRTGGVHALLHDVLTEDEINKLVLRFTFPVAIMHYVPCVTPVLWLIYSSM